MECFTFQVYLIEDCIFHNYRTLPSDDYPQKLIHTTEKNEHMLIYRQSFIGIEWSIPLVRVTNWFTATIVLNIREIVHNNVWMTWDVFFLLGHLISCPLSPSLCNSNKYERTCDPFSDGYQQITGLNGILLMFLWSLSWVLFNHYPSCCSHLVIDHGVRDFR